MFFKNDPQVDISSNDILHVMTNVFFYIKRETPIFNEFDKESKQDTSSVSVVFVFVNSKTFKNQLNKHILESKM